MYNNYEPNVKATITFIRLLKIKVSSLTVNETLQNHPDWPTLLSISDSLSKWNIPNAAAKIEVAEIDELPTPFIACTRDFENPLAVVTRVTETEIEAYQKNYSKQTIFTKAEFSKKWDGVYLIAEPNSHSGEEHYLGKRQKAFFNALIPALLIASGIILSLFLLTKVTGVVTFRSIGIYLQYAVLLAGVAVSVLLLWYEIDKSNPLLQKVCTGIAKGNCSAILSGKQSKVFSWLSWTEVGFFYFAGGLIIFLSASQLPASLFIVAWLNILAIPYTVFSVYYQWRVEKQWCVLCLAVQALLLFGGVNVFTNDFLAPFPQFSFLDIVQIILLYSFPVFTWFAIKPFILRLQQGKNEKRNYLRIKFDSEIFNTLLKKQKAITISADGLGIDIGNPSAKNTLIKVCSPTCGPCGKAHPKIEELWSKIKM